MFGLMNLHRFAAARGDGLRPELLELLCQQHLPSAANVEWIADYRPNGHQQAGCAPKADLARADLSNVVSLARGDRSESVRQVIRRRR